MGLISELRRRNVFRVGIAYAILGWVVIQVTDTVAPVLNLPDWTLAMVTWVGIIGFPFALLLAWAFELTPEGIKHERDVDRSVSITSTTGRKLDFVIIALLALGLGYFFWESRLAGQPEAVAVTATNEAAAVAEPAALEGRQRRQALNTATKESPSIAVLPFVNMSGDESQEFFADGLSEELLNLLAQTRGLKVTARTSSFAFKGQNKSIGEIAAALKVKTVLEGSVRRAGDRLRVTAQLINAADEYHLWSQSYDREMTNIFELQDDIAGEIITALRGHLDPSTAPNRGRPTENLEAYNLYLQAMDRIRSDDYFGATGLLEQAIELAPDFAEAHQQLAIAWWSLSGDFLEMREGLAAAHREATVALDLDPSLSHARTILLGSDPDNYDRYLELQSFEALVREQPQNSKARLGLIYDLLILGYFREALDIAREGVERDPIYGAGHARYGQALYATGDIETARKEMEIAASLNAYNGYWYAANQALLEGDDDAAIEYLSRIELQSETYVETVRAFLAMAREAETDGESLVSELKTRSDRYLEYGFLLIPLGLLDAAYEYLEHLGAFRRAPTNADYAIQGATTLTGSGFTAHPRYVEMATAYGLAAVWERRGAPDHCDKVDGRWQCR